MKTQEQDATAQSQTTQSQTTREQQPNEAKTAPEKLTQASVQSARPQSEKFAHSETNSPNINEAVQRRAYQIYEERASANANGSEIEDWLQAEAELGADTRSTKAA